MTISKQIRFLPRLSRSISWFVVAVLAVTGIFGCDKSGQQETTGTLPLELQIQESIDRGVQHLSDQQTDSGLWRSQHYGNLKSGAAMTAFVLYALSDHPFSNKSLLQKAVDQLLPNIRAEGYVTNDDGPDYSNYGSAMLLVACRKLELNLPDEDRVRLIDYLLRSQLDSGEGIDSENVDFGGWDLNGWMTGSRPTTGTNISVSASVIEALVLDAEREGAGQALARAKLWIRRLQNHPGDGGFFFHPKRDHDGNKAAWADGNARAETRSYGSATADGLRIMSYLGEPADSEAVQAAVEWLAQHDDASRVPGFEHETESGTWANGLRYYYYNSLSQVLASLPRDTADLFAQSIVAQLMSEQRDDGSWSNENARMREDDPLIATGFAVIALGNCKKWLGK